MITTNLSTTKKIQLDNMTMNEKYFELPTNMNRACRVCLAEGTNFTSIFWSDKQNTQNPSICQKIQTCGAIELNERDGMPSLICKGCIDKANAAHAFRQQCQKSDARLRVYYNKPSKPKLKESSTQTELSKKAEDYNSSYVLKEEIAVNADLPSTIQVFTPNGEVTEAELVTEEKLYLCNIDFNSKDLSKHQMIIAESNPSCNIVHSMPVQPIEAETIVEPVDRTITEMKTSDQLEQYIAEHLLSAERSSETTESTVDPGSDAKSDSEWCKTETPPKRATRKAKPSAGKSYSVDSADEDSPDVDEPKFKCRVCSKRYNTLKGLKNHAQVHDKKQECPTCLKPFFKVENLEKHVRTHDLKPHACQVCHASFAKAQSLTRHAKVHSIDSEREVEVKKSDSDEEDDTTEEFNIPGLYKCDVCDQYCSTQKNLRRHALVHGEKKYSCTVCKKWFFRADTLKKHAEKHGHGLLDNLVDENKLYESDDEAPEPVVNRESEDEASGEYRCQHCDKIMTTKKGLRRHVSMHKPKCEPVACEVCKKICASAARLAIHLKTHNKPKEKVPREYLCHICSKVYPSNSSLTYHMRTHTGIKPHVCKTCNSAFTTTTSLANHIRIHTGDKPFVCHVCSAAFAVSSAFRRHLTRHTGEANYLCKTCGKAFKRLSTLKEHTYTHSGEKPYVCKTCGAAYSHSGSLFAHQKRCRAQYGDISVEEPHTGHHIHVSNVQTAVRSLTVIGQMF